MTQTILMPCIEKNIQLKSVLTNFVHLFNFIYVEECGNFFCVKSGYTVISCTILL